MLSATGIEIAKLLVSFFGFLGTILALLFGFKQYQRNEQWKRCEFVAKNIQDFETNPTVRNALLMIDWGSKNYAIPLQLDPAKDTLTKVTQEIQRVALLPHPLRTEERINSISLPSAIEADRDKAGFAPIEVMIRNSYDVLFEYLERFANFIQSKLVDSDEFRPYLIYWLKTMTTFNENNPHENAAWCGVLLTYINFYGYPGVKYLLKVYGIDIDPDSELYQTVRNSMPDQGLAEHLYQSLRAVQR